MVGQNTSKECPNDEDGEHEDYTPVVAVSAVPSWEELASQSLREMQSHLKQKETHLVVQQL